MTHRVRLLRWLVVGVSVALFAAACGGGSGPLARTPATSLSPDEQYLADVRPILGPRASAPDKGADDKTLLDLRDTMCRRFKSDPWRWESSIGTMAIVAGTTEAEAARALRIMVRSGCPELIKLDPQPAI